MWCLFLSIHIKEQEEYEHPSDVLSSLSVCISFLSISSYVRVLYVDCVCAKLFFVIFNADAWMKANAESSFSLKTFSLIAQWFSLCGE